LKPDPRFLGQPKEFWAHVRTISQEIGYTNRRTKSIHIPTVIEIMVAFQRLGLTSTHITDRSGAATAFGDLLCEYFKYRALVLNHFVQGVLMNKDSAATEFARLRDQLQPTCPLPMNKQKGDKKNYAYLTGIVNMLIQANIGNTACNYDPRSLTTITHDAMPLRTLARRVDGAFPSIVNPVAIWEIKEYYYTTTFGSRVADGVYETLLDGMELEELEAVAHRKIHHLLVIDDHFTWWIKGRSYLCRLVDMLHMGFVGEVIFGREIFTRLPVLVREWRAMYDALPKMDAAQAGIVGTRV
jgi:hypothetical protein